MFELMLSAISTGGLVGASNQYMCLLVLSVAARLGWVGVVPQLEFVQSWWFIAVVATFWVLTVLPAYGTALSPGVMNVVNTIVNILSGFLVPISAALLAMTAAGVIAEMNPTMHNVLLTLGLFGPEGQGIGRIGWIVAGGAGVTAATVTGAKFLAKPAVSSATGALGTSSAPIYAAVENVASILLMVAVYILIQINPWLIVGLLAITMAAIIALFVWAVYQLWKLGKGIGRVIGLIETRPRAGLAVVSEFLMWGSGSLVWGLWARGAFRLTMWASWLAVLIFGFPALGAALAVAVAPVPVLEFLVGAFLVSAEVMTVVLGLFVGGRSARSLMAKLEKDPPHAASPAGANAAPATQVS